MSRRRWIAFAVIVLLIELAALTAVIIFKKHADAAVTPKKASVIEGSVIDVTEAADGGKSKPDC